MWSCEKRESISGLKTCTFCRAIFARRKPADQLFRFSRKHRTGNHFDPADVRTRMVRRIAVINLCNKFVHVKLDVQLRCPAPVLIDKLQVN